ncbi:hypothetical protein LXL04_010586 [Taraxacum kok-saghyz]
MESSILISNFFQIPSNHIACIFQSLFPTLFISLIFGDGFFNWATLMADVARLHVIKEGVSNLFLTLDNLCNLLQAPTR